MTALAMPQHIYLHSYLQPFETWLGRDDVNEIIVNRPGEVWIETAGAPQMTRVDAGAIDDRLLERLAGQIARISHQAVNRQHPLLAATLPDGARVQMVGPPAARHWSLAIRRHIASAVDLTDFACAPPSQVQSDRSTIDMQQARTSPIEFLKHAVRNRKTILISGGTSSGKTTFLNALAAFIPEHERIVLVEDTPEIRVPHANCVNLVSVKGDMGEARVSVDDLLQASLRLRPDRIIVGELRGIEATTFLRAVNTGHPGSLSTIHASSARGALEQLALLTMQAGWSLTRSDTLAYAASVVDVVVQLSRRGGVRSIEDIEVLGEVGRVY